MSQLLQELLCKLTGVQLLCRLQLLRRLKRLPRQAKATKATEATVSDCCALWATACWARRAVESARTCPDVSGGAMSL